MIEENDKKLARVLTQVQYGDFMGKPVEKRLQFMFRYQQWVDVLDWFAEQAELSLVVPETPPPGTLNYVDTREYTPVEAIDLMNSVLIHSGYTLVRRNRMLMVISLAGGIPEDVVPLVSLEDLDKRGKFELVSVRFPIGRRSADSVTGAISPLLSNYGKVVSIAPSAGNPGDRYGQDHAAGRRDHRGDAGTGGDGDARAGRNARASGAAGLLRQDGRPDHGGEHLNPACSHRDVRARSRHEPDQRERHGVAARVGGVGFGKDGGGAPAGEAAGSGSLSDRRFPRGRPHPTTFSRRKRYVANGAGAQLLETLQKIVPGAELTINEAAGTLLALATPAEHETIKTALEKLVIERAPTETKQLQTYRLTKSDPDTTLTLLETILPDARLTVDPQTRTLVALAVPADQAVIEKRSRPSSRRSRGRTLPSCSSTNCLWRCRPACWK